MARTVDPYRFTTPGTRRVAQAWIKREPARAVPWTRLAKPLSDCVVAIVSSGAIAMRSDRPFDQEGERRDPWWGDPSHRVLPRTATASDVAIYHLHVNVKHAERDLNCMLPLERLLELEREGVVGKSAPSHYSFQGYLLDAREFLDTSVPAMIRSMKAEGVDLALLVPV
jgi:D-proline reductase (dithiol) PrdB